MSQNSSTTIKELGAGLILRRSSPADADALAEFCGAIQSDEADQLDELIVAWTRDLLIRPHPGFHPNDFTVVEEVATGRIVSTTNLISQKWSYEGIPFGVGRPELVGTLPEFRNRGLIRHQFDEIHRWSEQRGEMVQAITGIPFYYRLFGYEMALDLDGSRRCYQANIPELPAGRNEPCTFRAASAGDVSFIADVYRHGFARYPIACIRDEAVWRYELWGRDPIVTQGVLIIESPDGEPLGFVRHLPDLRAHSITVTAFELRPRVSWLEVTPAVMRHLWKMGQDYAARDRAPCRAVIFMLGESHPTYDLFRERLPQRSQSYAWYIRVSDLPRFLKHIAPALEHRLSASGACGFTGQTRVSFYRSGLQFSFESGRLVAVVPWMPGPRELEGDIAFPGLTFLQLLFGYRSLPELRSSFADCWWNTNEIRALFEALFPKKPSQVIGLS